jgi:molecular chaperone GrpE
MRRKKKKKAEEQESPKDAEDIEDLRKRAAERDEYYDLLLRARADLENFTKRTEKEKARWREGTLKDFISDLLPVLDALHAAALHPEDTDAASVLDGINLMDKQLAEAFGTNGVSIIEPEIGDEFDPAFHEAMMMEPSDEFEPGRIMAVLRRGFVVSDTLVRAAQVKVAAGTSEEDSVEEEGPRPEEAGDG